MDIVIANASNDDLVTARRFVCGLRREELVMDLPVRKTLLQPVEQC